MEIINIKLSRANKRTTREVNAGKRINLRLLSKGGYTAYGLICMGINLEEMERFHSQGLIDGNLLSRYKLFSKLKGVIN